MQRQGMKDLMFVKLQVAYAWVVHAYVHTRYGKTRQSNHAGRSAVRRTHPAGGTRPAGEAPRAAARGPGGNPRREEERVRCGGALDGQHTCCLPCRRLRACRGGRTAASRRLPLRRGGARVKEHAQSFEVNIYMYLLFFYAGHDTHMHVRVSVTRSRRSISWAWRSVR